MKRLFVLHSGLLGSPESLGLDRAAMAAILISALRVPRRPFTAVTTALLSSHMDLCHRYPGLNPLSLSKIRSLDRDRAVAIPDDHVSATSTRLRYCRTTRCFPRRLRTPLIDSTIMMILILRKATSATGLCTIDPLTEKTYPVRTTICPWGPDHMFPLE
jgi:hypothetical protein